MPPLSRGLYEVLLTKALEKHRRDPEQAGDPELAELRTAEAGERIALHPGDGVCAPASPRRMLMPVLALAP